MPSSFRSNDVLYNEVQAANRMRSEHEYQRQLEIQRQLAQQSVYFDPERMEYTCRELFSAPPEASKVKVKPKAKAPNPVLLLL